jgi:hypothetical protein
LALAPPLIEWNLKARGGYAEIAPAYGVILLLLHRTLKREPCGATAFALDVAIGFSSYCLELLLPLGATAALFFALGVCAAETLEPGCTYTRYGNNVSPVRTRPVVAVPALAARLAP